MMTLQKVLLTMMGVPVPRVETTAVPLVPTMMGIPRAARAEMGAAPVARGEVTVIQAKTMVIPVTREEIRMDRQLLEELVAADLRRDRMGL